MGQCYSSQTTWDIRGGHEGVDQMSPDAIYQTPDLLGDYLISNLFQYNLPIEYYVYYQWTQHMRLYKDSIMTDCMIYHHIAMVLPILSRYVSRIQMVNLLRAFPFIKESYGAFLSWIIEWQPLSCNIARNWNFLNELHRLTSRKILRVVTVNVEEHIYERTLNDLFVPGGWGVETIPFGNTDHAFSLLINCKGSFSNNLRCIGVNLNKIRKLTVNCSSFPRNDEWLTIKLLRKIKFWFGKICCSSADGVRILAVERCSPILVAMLINMVEAYLIDFNMKMHIQDDRDVIIIRLPNEPKIKFFQRSMLTDDLGMIKGINHLRIQDARQMADRRPIPFAVTFKILQYSQATTLRRISCDVPLYAAFGANFTVNLPYLTQLSVIVDGPLDIFLSFRSLQILKLTNYKNSNLLVQSIIYCSGDDWYASNIWELMEQLKHLVILRKDPNEPVEYIRKYSKEIFEYRRSISASTSQFRKHKF